MTTLTDLPWEDILIPHLICYLSWQDIFHLRATCIKSKHLVERYLKLCKVIALGWPDSIQMSENTFSLITSNKSNITALIISGPTKFSYENINNVLCNNSALQELHLYGVLNDYTLKCLTLTCKQLKKLVLINCAQASSEALKLIVRSHCHMQWLEISHSMNVNDEVIMNLNCLPLKYLAVAHSAITDESLFYMANHCPDLILLNIQGCWKCSDQGIRRIGEYCKKLKHLLVEGCRDVTEVSLKPLRAKMTVDRPLELSGRNLFLPGINLQV